MLKRKWQKVCPICEINIIDKCNKSCWVCYLEFGNKAQFNKGNVPWNKGSKECTWDNTGERNPNWKGGILENVGGYRMCYAPEHPRAKAKSRNNTRHKYVYEHILVAEKALGRYLKLGEIVHHINGNRSDNRNCNLLICTRKYHAWLEGQFAMLYKKEHFG